MPSPNLRGGIYSSSVVEGFGDKVRRRKFRGRRSNAVWQPGGGAPELLSVGSRRRFRSFFSFLFPLPLIYSMKREFRFNRLEIAPKFVYTPVNKFVMGGRGEGSLNGGSFRFPMWRFTCHAPKYGYNNYYCNGRQYTYIYVFRVYVLSFAGDQSGKLINRTRG